VRSGSNRRGKDARLAHKFLFGGRGNGRDSDKTLNRFSILLRQIIIIVSLMIALTGFIFLAFCLSSIGNYCEASEIPHRANHYRRTLTRAASTHFGLNAPISLFAAQIHQESAWRPNVCSPYACGLAQFTKPTASDMGRWYPGIGKPDVFDPVWSIQALVLYNLRNYRSTKGVDGESDRWAMALAKYNGGPGWINRERNRCKKIAACDHNLWWGNVGRYCHPRRRASACKENRHYPDKIINRLQPIYYDAGWGGPFIKQGD